MFDTALLESRRDRKSRRKGAGLPLAIGLHVAVIGAFVGASVWSVGEPPDAVTHEVIFVPSPALPSEAGSRPPSHSGTEGRRGHAAPAFPRAVDPVSSSPDVDSRASVDPTPDTGETEGPQAEPGGGPHGPGTLDGPGGGGGGMDEGVLRPGGDVKAPVLVLRAEPDYPEAARRAHLDGVVILEAVITANGEVNDIRILRSANPLLDAAAEKAVRQWRYKPATLNGRAVSVYLTVTVTFGLKS